MSKEDCERLRENCAKAGSNEKVNLALFGKDGRGGIVKDIADIKSQLSLYGGAVGRVAVPIAVGIIVALLVKFL